MSDDIERADATTVRATDPIAELLSLYAEVTESAERARAEGFDAGLAFYNGFRYGVLRAVELITLDFKAVCDTIDGRTRSDRLIDLEKRLDAVQELIRVGEVSLLVPRPATAATEWGAS